MCLAIKPQIEKQLRRRFAKTPRITAWKVVERSRHWAICSEYHRYCWRIGWNQSGRKKVELDEDEKMGDVSAGIHVYLWENDAVQLRSGSHQAVLPVRCSISDLVAAGLTASLMPSAVFSKVFVRKADYKAADIALATKARN